MNFVVSFVNQEVEVALSCQSESFDVEYTNTACWKSWLLCVNVIKMIWFTENVKFKFCKSMDTSFTWKGMFSIIWNLW